MISLLCMWEILPNSNSVNAAGTLSRLLPIRSLAHNFWAAECSGEWSSSVIARRWKLLSWAPRVYSGLVGVVTGMINSCWYCWREFLLGSFVGILNGILNGEEKFINRGMSIYIMPQPFPTIALTLDYPSHWISLVPEPLP